LGADSTILTHAVANALAGFFTNLLGQIFCRVFYRQTAWFQEQYPTACLRLLLFQMVQQVQWHLCGFTSAWRCNKNGSLVLTQSLIELSQHRFYRKCHRKLEGLEGQGGQRAGNTFYI
jgi:hypothetical protein